MPSVIEGIFDRDTANSVITLPRREEIKKNADETNVILSEKNSTANPARSIANEVISIKTRFARGVTRENLSKKRTLSGKVNKVTEILTARLLRVKVLKNARSLFSVSFLSSVL